MNKCKYCENKAEWLNPYNNSYLCNDHAIIKCKELMKEYNEINSDTPKDWFIKIIEDDPNLIDTILDTKVGEVINNANNSW